MSVRPRQTTSLHFNRLECGPIRAETGKRSAW
jgi:hypothetical protein